MDDTDTSRRWIGNDGIFYENVSVGVYGGGKNHFHLLLAEGFCHGVLVLSCMVGSINGRKSYFLRKIFQFILKNDVLYQNGRRNETIMVL
jgi:hypothetical protein